VTNNKLKQTPLAATVAKGQLGDGLESQATTPASKATEIDGKTPNQHIKPNLREGSTLYYATLRLNEADRHRIVNTLEFIRTLSSCLIGVHEPTVAQTKLQWWSDEINRLAIREPRHPLTQRCAPELAGKETVQRHLSTILDAATAARFDMPEDDEAWLELVQRDYAARLALVHSCVSGHESTSQPSLDEFTTAVAWVDILSTLPGRIHHDNIALPPSMAQQFDLSQQDLRNHLRVQGRSEPETGNTLKIQALLNAAIDQAANEMTKAIQSPTYQTLPKHSHSKALVSWLHMRHAQLGLWQKTRPDLLRETMTLTPLRKWYIAFKYR